jgi:O-antigen/teichoic acid export membrane protein
MICTSRLYIGRESRDIARRPLNLDVPTSAVPAPLAVRATASVGLLTARYFVVGILNLGGSVFLIRRLGPEVWASYSVALLLTTFVDQQLGARLLGALQTRATLPRALVDAAAAVTQASAAICVLLLLPAAWIAGELTSLPGISLTIAAAAGCSCIYAWRAVPVAVLERRLAFRWIAGGEVLDQVTFLAIAVPAVVLGAGIEAVAVGLAVRGVPTLLLLRARVRAPWLGRFGSDVRDVLSFAVPGSLSALCFLGEALLPLILLGADHPVLLGFIMTAASTMSYPAVLVIVLQRITLPILSRVREKAVALAGVVHDVSLAAAASLVASVGPLALTSPWWMSALFGPEWEAAWPQAVGIGGSYILMGAINVGLSALLARGGPRDAAVTWAAMLGTWAVGGVAITSLGATRWILLGLIASKVIGFALVFRLLARRDAAVHPAGMLAASLGGIASAYAGAAALSAGRPAIAVAAALSLTVISAVSLYASRPLLAHIWASTRPRLPYGRAREPS